MNGTKRNTVVRTKHCLLVCTACASVWKDGKRQGKSGGQQFMEDLSKLAKDWELSDEFEIQEVECMSACSHSCAVSFAAAGKYTYLFGDLPPNEPESVELRFHHWEIRDKERKIGVAELEYEFTFFTLE
ncbi:MAG: DUF1636 domain-containing protein [Oscillatoriales cyanobacterium]|nr:MAG: DUF1636 domain-containing protein [Oscillatoriales cyanobacterium]